MLTEHETTIVRLVEQMLIIAETEMGLSKFRAAVLMAASAEAVAFLESNSMEEMFEAVHTALREINDHVEAESANVIPIWRH